MANTQTDVVTPRNPLTILPKYGRAFVVKPGDRLLVWTSRRNRTLGGNTLTVGIPAHDPILGEYITDHPTRGLFDLREDSIEYVERAPRFD